MLPLTSIGTRCTDFIDSSRKKEIWIRSVEDHTVPVFQQTSHKENRPSNIQDREGYGKDKTVSAVQASTSASSASDVGSVGACSAPGSMTASLVKNPTIHEAAISGDGVDAGWILAIEPSFRNATPEHLYETAIDAFHEVLVDSGAERCVCPPFWARDAPNEAQLNPSLVTASGEPLDHFGCRRVNLSFAGVQPV